MLAIVHNVIKSECECMTLSQSDLEAIRNKQTNALKLADFQVFVKEVKDFKKKNKHEPNTKEMDGIIEGGNAHSSLDKLLGDKFVRKVIIKSEMLDLSKFVDMQTWRRSVPHAISGASNACDRRCCGNVIGCCGQGGYLDDLHSHDENQSKKFAPKSTFVVNLDRDGGAVLAFEMHWARQKSQESERVESVDWSEICHWLQG